MANEPFNLLKCNKPSMILLLVGRSTAGFSGLVTWLQSASLFLGAAGSKITLLLCLGLSTGCSFSLSVSVFLFLRDLLSFTGQVNFLRLCWKHFKVSKMEPIHLLEAEAAETHTISFYWSKEVIRPAQIQGTGKHNSPFDWKNCN